MKLENAQAAMQIILHAGNAKDYLHQAMELLMREDQSTAAIFALFEKADQELIEGHKCQTKVIQETIEENTQELTLLFIHAQDTLMTTKSEYVLMKNMVMLVQKLMSREESDDECE